MSNVPVASGDLVAKWTIEFKLRAALARKINQPAIVDDPVGLAVFGDSAMIYLAEVTDPGAKVYAKLGTIEAKTYIHGWTVNGGWIYVLDGVEVNGFDLRTGKPTASIALLTGADAEAASNALAELKKAQKKVEWATLLEQAEEEWIRVTAQQAAAAPGSAKRDELDIVAVDFFRMLKELREMTGSSGGGAAARQLVANLRKALATQRTAAAPWCFSAPVVRRRSFEEPQRSVFTVLGNGRVYAIDKSVTQSAIQKWKTQAELHLTLIEDLKSSLRLLAYVSEGTLWVLDAKTFAEVSSWTPETKPANGATQSLSSVKGQIWWTTDSAVYACKVDDTGKITPAWRSGAPWTTRQVGRLNPPVTDYNPPVDPNELFDTMNVRTWVEQRANPTAALNDGMVSLLALSDDAGKYTTPRAGTSYLVHGPFERDAGSGENRWTQVKPHHSGALVLLTDNRGASSFCRYPSLPSVSQLLPQWSAAPWLYSAVTTYSPLDLALSADWPSPARRFTKPHADMNAFLHASAAGANWKLLENIASMILVSKPIPDTTIRLILWYALHNTKAPGFFGEAFKDGKSFLDVTYNATEQQQLKTRFGQPGTQWDFFIEADFMRNLQAKKACQVNFDPPVVNKSIPANLFHSKSPLWYDPWGFNRPGDFIPEQPPASYLDPFCFNGQLRVPQRRINFDIGSKIRSWAVFTDNDPSTILRSVKPPKADGTPAPEPKPLRAAGDPGVLVISVDEDRQRSTFRVLPPRPLRTTFDTASHTLRNETAEFGSVGSQVLTAPVVYLNPEKPAGTEPTAWCVTATNFPSARLRAIATANADGVSPWDTFLDEKRASFGPATGSKTWKIETCPLPDDVLPKLELLGFGVPAS